MAMAMAMQCSSSASAFGGSSLKRVQGLPSLTGNRARARATPGSLSLNVQASGKKVKVDQPLGPCGDTKFREGKDASGRLAKGKGVYQFTNKYGANVDGYSPIYDPNDWSSSGDVYAGGKTGLIIWAVTLAGLLSVGAFLVYNTSALSG